MTFGLRKLAYLHTSKTLLMKYLASLLVFVLMASCSNDPKKETIEEDVVETGVTKNPDKMLIGRITEKSLKEAPFAEWYDANFEAYQPKDDVIQSLGGLLPKVYIQIIMGTWCEDSHIYVPALYKILESASYNTSTIKMVAVDRDKIEPKQNLKGLDIELVPTFIFYKDGIELGRIIESPEKTLEEDILALIP